MIQIAIVDDHQLVMEGFASLLGTEPNYCIKLKCSSIASAKQQVTSDIDIIIIDISLPDGNGIELLEYISKKFPDIKCLIVSMYDQTHYVESALRNGALAYLSKRTASNDLIAAVEHVIMGKSFMSQDVVEKLNFSHASHSQSISALLTEREREVLNLLALGLKPKNVAQQLEITPKTALVHRANIFKKLNISNQFELTKLALKEGLLSVEELVS